MSSGDEALNQLGLETSGLKKMLERPDKKVKNKTKNVFKFMKKETRRGAGGGTERQNILDNYEGF